MEYIYVVTKRRVLQVGECVEPKMALHMAADALGVPEKSSKLLYYKKVVQEELCTCCKKVSSRLTATVLFEVTPAEALWLLKKYGEITLYQEDDLESDFCTVVQKSQW